MMPSLKKNLSKKIVVVDRFVSDAQSTISIVSFENQFICFFLEDEYRDEKVFGQTRIPAGTYKLGITKAGMMNNCYAKDRRFRDFHKGMLHILNVPNFKSVFIHVGNKHTETRGCPLTGMQAQTTPLEMRVLQSAIAYKRLYMTIIDDVLNGSAYIIFRDNDLLGN